MIQSPLEPASRQLLAGLAGRPWSAEFYLAGSAALALHAGHRTVRDLDLMAPANRLGAQERRDLLTDLLALDPGFEVETARDGYLFSRAGSGVGLKLFYYPYPLVDPLDEFAGVAVASPVDLGLMKIGAIISRGGRRDFVDLFLLCRRVPLADLLARAPEKFGHVRDFPLQALKGLADRSQAATEPMPPMPPIPPIPPMPRPEGGPSWEEVETWLDAEVRELGRRHVGLGAPAEPAEAEREAAR